MSDNNGISEETDKLKIIIKQFDVSINKSLSSGSSGTTPDNGNSGEQKPDDNKPQESGEDKGSKKPQENTPSPSSEQDYDGESNAYNDIDLNKMSKSAKDEKKKTSNGVSGRYSPPKHDKPKKSDIKAKNFMDFVNEWVFEIYGDIIDAAVDLILDFMDFILIFAHQSDGKEEPEQEKKKKKNIFDYGDALIEKYQKRSTEMKEFSDKAHAEIMENINKEKAGIPAEWKIWKKEPKFFKKVVELSKKAEQNPNSEEAKKWEKFKSAPQIMEGLLKKELLLRKLSLGLSTIETALKDSNADAIPLEVVKKSNEMAKLAENKNIGVDELKEKIAEKITEMRGHIKDDTDLNKKLAEKIDKIEQLTKSSQSDEKKFRKSLAESIEKLQEVSPQEILIEKNSQKYYDAITENIEKIKETYKNDPNKRREVIHNYMINLKESLEKSHKSAEKYVTGKNVALKKKRHNAAAKDFVNARYAINEFVVEDKALKSIETPKREAINPLTGDNKYKIFEAIKGFSR